MKNFKNKNILNKLVNLTLPLRRELRTSFEGWVMRLEYAKFGPEMRWLKTYLFLKAFEGKREKMPIKWNKHKYRSQNPPKNDIRIHI